LASITTITSVATFLGISIALYLGKGIRIYDDWAAYLPQIYFLYNSYLIFLDLRGIMDEHLYDDLVIEIRIESKSRWCSDDTEKCFIRKSGMKYHVDLHYRTANGNINVKRRHDRYFS
jgi:divalent metal cation (Fe/Co/Zn/Cd) transporter